MSNPPFAQQVLADADHWALFLAEEWSRDFPDRNSEMRWKGELAKWIAAGRGGEDRSRTTRVMHKLRRTSPREYETLYRAMILGESFEAITAWLNERAERNGIPLPDGRSAHYTVRDAVALFLCAVEFCRSSW